MLTPRRLAMKGHGKAPGPSTISGERASPALRAASYSGVFTLLPLLTGEGQDHHGEILRAAT